VAVVPDMARLHVVEILNLSLPPDCGIAGNTLNLQGPFSVSSQSVAALSSFVATSTLDDLAQGFHVTYRITGTVRAVDGAVAATFTYAGTYAGGATSGSGTINGAAAGVEIENGTLTGRATGIPSCNFAGSVDILRGP